MDIIQNIINYDLAQFSEGTGIPLQFAGIAAGAILVLSVILGVVLA